MEKFDFDGVKGDMDPFYPCYTSTSGIALQEDTCPTRLSVKKGEVWEGIRAKEE
jgi:hypothetical protein